MDEVGNIYRILMGIISCKAAIWKAKGNKMILSWSVEEEALMMCMSLHCSDSETCVKRWCICASTNTHTHTTYQQCCVSCFEME